MLKVYCDTGAYRNELAELEAQGLVRVCQFKYENRNKKIKHIAPPSMPRMPQIHYKWNELHGVTWADLRKQSDKWSEILRVVGKGNLVDAKHLDSAYREGCHVFLTSDKGDVVSRRDEIHVLLGLSILHFQEDWDAFQLLLASGG